MMLSVEPDPVTVSTQPATIRVTWDSGDKRGGEVRVVRDGGPEVLFAAGPSGSEEATWIALGASYEFRLYRPRRRDAVASLTIGTDGSVASGRPPVRRLLGRGRPLVRRLLGRGRPLVRRLLRRGRPYLRASPNPVALGATAGRTRLIWDTGNGSNGLITVATRRRTRREDEILVASGTNGDQEIDWIRRDVLYRFRLYRETTAGKAVAEVRVTMGFERLEVLADVAVLLAIALPPLLILALAAIVTRRVVRIVRA